MVMKKLLQVVALIAAAGVLWSGVPGDEAIAVSGCCKQRPNVNARWRNIGSNFEQCRQLNEEQDQGDDIFNPDGKIWWDVGC